MVKLSASQNYLAAVLYQEFHAFYLDSTTSSWIFQKAVSCKENAPSSEGFIECCAFSPCEKYFGICFDKNIIIYFTSNWNVFQLCPGERKASSLKFFPKTKNILIADKSGCATFYSFKNELQKTELALGHNSMLTSALITDDENFVITSDRDEKIRVSNYPNVYDIETYCLGHEMFVSCIGFLPTDKQILISSSGDGSIRFWDFVQGRQIAFYNMRTSDETSNSTIIKFVTCKVNETSILAILTYKSNKISIIKINGKSNTNLDIEYMNTLTLKCVPWDIEFHDNILVCLLPDQLNPIILWCPDLKAPQDKFLNIKLHLSDNWKTFIDASTKILDEVPVLFKREIDNLQEYEQRKKARLLKTGKTS